jgi:hypothetical protein
MKFFLSTIIISLLAFMLFACGGGSKNIPTAGNNNTGVLNSSVDLSAGKHVSSTYSGEHADWTYPLIAGQWTDGGTVKLWNDDGSFYTVFDISGMDPGWFISTVHVGFWDGATTPPSKGNPGQFQLAWTAPDESTRLTPELSISFADLLSGKGKYAPGFAVPEKGTVHIALHVQALKSNGDGTYESVTIWGQGDENTWDFNWTKQWGGGVDVNVMPTFALPADGYNYTCSYPYAPYSYWKLDFDTAPSMPFPGSNPWKAWCVDPQAMYAGYHGPMTLVSCYDLDWLAANPYADSPNWDLISYMINKRLHNGYTTYDWRAFQDAVWYFKYGTGAYTPTWLMGAAPDCTAPNLSGSYINDAIANGEGYIPGAGDYFAVIVWPGLGSGYYWWLPTKFQTLIIEVDP